MIKRKIFAYIAIISVSLGMPIISLAYKQCNLCSTLSSVTGENSEENSFFGLIFRTKYIDRWGILVNREKESLNDHLLDTSRIAHMLVLIKNKKYGSNLDAERAAVLAMYHDTAEIATDDLPTPVKYSNSQIKPIYDKLEDQVVEELVSKLPDEFKDEFYSILKRQEYEQELWKIVKYADTISALIKCLREKSLGNRDFDKAYDRLEKNVLEIEAPEVQYFLKTFLPVFGFTYTKV